MKNLFFVVAILLVGCTDSTRASIGALGEPAHVTCYSGGVKVYEGESTGVVHATSHSDGWEFREVKSGQFVRVSGASSFV